MAADGGEVQRDTCGRQGNNLHAVKASGTGLVVGSRCSCKQLLAIVFWECKRRERERQRVAASLVGVLMNKRAEGSWWGGYFPGALTSRLALCPMAGRAARRGRRCCCHLGHVRLLAVADWELPGCGVGARSVFAHDFKSATLCKARSSHCPWGSARHGQAAAAGSVWLSTQTDCHCSPWQFTQ